MTTNWTWTLNSQKYPVYTKYLPQRPKFALCHFTNCCFQDISSPKIRNILNDPKLSLNTQQLQLHYIHWILTPGAQIVVRFAPQLAVSKIQGCQKSEMHQMTPNRTWTLNSQKYPVYTR